MVDSIAEPGARRSRISGALRNVVHRCSVGLLSRGDVTVARTLRPGLPGSSTWPLANVQLHTESAAHDGDAGGDIASPHQGNDSTRSVIGRCLTVWDAGDGE